MAKRVLPGIGSGLPWSLGDVLASTVAHAVAQVTKGILAPPGDTWRSGGSGLDALITAELAKADLVTKARERTKNASDLALLQATFARLR